MDTEAYHLFFVLTIAWFILMTWLSHQDGEHTGETSRELARYLQFLNSDVGQLNSQLRRAAHVIVFAVFTLLLGITLHMGEKPAWILGFPIFWAWADERTKPFIKGRHFSWIDVGLNLIGTGIGGTIYFLMLRFL